MKNKNINTKMELTNMMGKRTIAITDPRVLPEMRRYCEENGITELDTAIMGEEIIPLWPHGSHTVKTMDNEARKREAWACDRANAQLKELGFKLRKDMTPAEESMLERLIEEIDVLRKSLAGFKPLDG